VAIPVLFWMIECTGCGTRRVVKDRYLRFVGTGKPNPAPGEGYAGPPLPERYGCANGCSRPMKAIGWRSLPDSDEMWQHEPYMKIRMTRAEADEWRQLIRAAGYE
jgi:hypothetical protein